MTHQTPANTLPESNKKKINKRAFIAIGLTATACWIFAFLAMKVFEDYAWGLFIWLPVFLGVSSSLLYGYGRKVNRSSLLTISQTTLLIFCLGLLLFAWEGIICIIMAFPIGMLLTWLGHLIGHRLLKSKVGNSTTTIGLLFLAIPTLMAFENANQDDNDLRSVTTSILIDASPEEVWKNVIAFPQLEEPNEFIFKTGIAYPINATIKGQGVGAIRHCNFSTGSFVEPITVWDEPKLLKFSVDEQPATMKEISLYDIKPNHLHGYWVSKQGQFKLTKLANGTTLLEGTTWYVNRIKPGFYWTIWSDYIVHQIHNRVLKHIKRESEET